MNTEEKTCIRDARELGVPKMLLLGLQHMFAMFGATILVPILVNTYFEGEGLSVQVTLFFAGVGTLFFHLCSKFKVPAFLGSSFAFLGGFATVANLDTGIFADMTMGEKLPYACGGIVVAGLLYLVLALIIKLVGVKKVMRFLPPESCTVSSIKCFHKLVTGIDRSWRHRYLQYLGQGYVQDHPDPDGCCDLLYCSADHALCRYDKCRWLRYPEFLSGSNRCGSRSAAFPALQV